MTSMPMPDWYTGMKEKKDQVFDAEVAPAATGFDPVVLEKVDVFSTHFAEFELRKGDVLLHLFPRAGAGDRWEMGQYINRCANCRGEVDIPENISKPKPCPTCQHGGLVYIPGRMEEKSSHAFPDNASSLIKAAVDKAWAGDVAIVFVEELGAYAVQIQRAASAADVAGPFNFVTVICTEFDRLLDELPS